MSFMDKLESSLNNLLVPIAVKLNSQRHIAAVRDAFITAFPLTMAGSIILLINFTLLDPSGFIASLLRLESIFPNLAAAQDIFTPVVNGTTNVMSIFVVYLIAKNLTRTLGGDDTFAGITALGAFFIMYPPYVETVDGGSALATGFLGAQGLFVAMLVGLITGEVFHWLSNMERLQIKMPEQVPTNVAKSFSNLIPIILILVFFSVANYLITMIVPEGIHELIFRTIQAPLQNLGGNVFTIMIFAFISNLLWVMGIHGPNTIAAVRDPIFTPMGLENLDFIADAGTTVGIPYPYNWGSLNDGFGNYGGSGMTLGLLIAIFIFSKREDYKNIARLSIAPGLFNINEPVVFGLPIVLNPIMMIPFILTPMINIGIGYLAISLELMNPIGYSVPWTTPGPLIPFLGSGGDWRGLVVGFVALGVSVLTYTPFVLAANGALEKVAEDDSVPEDIPV
jgi:PTS system cellobiose-specific IIC component